jgi:hypothetical protein
LPAVKWWNAEKWDEVPFDFGRREANCRRSSKHQTPSSREIPNFKFQIRAHLESAAATGHSVQVVLLLKSILMSAIIPNTTASENGL